jgi:hypothetical protein
MAERICHCDLTGDLHVVDEDKRCQLCNWNETQEINAESMKKVISYYNDRLAEVINDQNSGHLWRELLKKYMRFIRIWEGTTLVSHLVEGHEGFAQSEVLELTTISQEIEAGE